MLHDWGGGHGHLPDGRKHRYGQIARNHALQWVDMASVLPSYFFVGLCVGVLYLLFCNPSLSVDNFFRLHRDMYLHNAFPVSRLSYYLFHFSLLILLRCLVLQRQKNWPEIQSSPRNTVQLMVDLFSLIPSTMDWPMIRSQSLKMSMDVKSPFRNYPIVRTVSDWDFDLSDAHLANSVKKLI